MKLTDQEWLALITPKPYAAEGRVLTEAETHEVGALTTSIFHGCNSALRALEEYSLSAPRMIDLVMEKIDPEGTWRAWSTHADGAVAQVVSARKAHSRLVELLGADATVRNHGWDNGMGHISLREIDEHVNGAEAAAEPFRLLAKLLKGPVRRAA